MGSKQPDNGNIRIGEIFQEIFRDECGSSCAFYQVVGKRAKTLVELRPIAGERFVDETCRPGLGQVLTRPLPGRFFERAAVITAGVCWPSAIDGRKCLRGRGGDSWRCFSEMREGETFRLSGYDAVHAMERLKEEGKIPT